MTEKGKLVPLVMAELELKTNNPAAKEYVEIIVRQELKYNKQYWLKKYNTMLDSYKFTDQEVTMFSDFYRRFKALIEQEVIDASLGTVKCRIDDIQGKLRIILDIDATKFIKA